MKQKFKIRNIISITVLKLIQMQNLYMSQNLLINYPNLKDLRHIHNTKDKVLKMYILVIPFFTG